MSDSPAAREKEGRLPEVPGLSLSSSKEKPAILAEVAPVFVISNQSPLASESEKGGTFHVRFLLRYSVELIVKGERRDWD